MNIEKYGVRKRDRRKKMSKRATGVQLNESDLVLWPTRASLNQDLVFMACVNGNQMTKQKTEFTPKTIFIQMMKEKWAKCVWFKAIKYFLHDICSEQLVVIFNGFREPIQQWRDEKNKEKKQQCKNQRHWATRWIYQLQYKQHPLWMIYSYINDSQSRNWISKLREKLTRSIRRTLFDTCR